MTPGYCNNMYSVVHDLNTLSKDIVLYFMQCLASTLPRNILLYTFAKLLCNNHLLTDLDLCL